MTDDLVKRLRVGPTIDSFESMEIMTQAADRIEQLESALREIENTDNWEGMDWVGDGSPRWIARAAIGEER